MCFWDKRRKNRSQFWRCVQVQNRWDYTIIFAIRTYHMVVMGGGDGGGRRGLRSCFTENKLFLWHFTRNKILISRFTKQEMSFLDTNLRNLLYLKVTATKDSLVRCLIVHPLLVLRAGKINPSKNAKRDDCPVTVRQYC